LFALSITTLRRTVRQFYVRMNFVSLSLDAQGERYS
jgi:hypothetical protein